MKKIHGTDYTSNEVVKLQLLHVKSVRPNLPSSTFGFERLSVSNLFSTFTFPLLIFKARSTNGNLRSCFPCLSQPLSCRLSHSFPHSSFHSLTFISILCVSHNVISPLSYSSLLFFSFLLFPLSLTFPHSSPSHFLSSPLPSFFHFSLCSRTPKA